MDSHTKHSAGSEQQTPETSKRRFLKALAAAPVAASLASTKVHAFGGDYDHSTPPDSTGTNCSISGMMSGNQSAANRPYECRRGTGKSPGYWKNHPGCWPGINPAGFHYGTFEAKPKTGRGKMEDLPIPLPCDYLKNNGTLNSAAFTFEYPTDGTSLDAFIQLLTGVNLNLFSGSLMYYLTSNMGYEKHVASTMLSIAHPNISMPYTAQEIVDAIIFAEANGKIEQLHQILHNLEGDADSENSALVTHATSCS